MFSVVDYYNSHFAKISQEHDSDSSKSSDVEELDRVSKVMSLHPTYWENYKAFRQFVIVQDGPLPYATRHYLGIIAAARHQCTFLIEYHKKVFLDVGGDKNWLKGLDHIPQKLRDIYEMNKVLAHRPWMFTKAHIEQLTKGTNGRWSVSEAVHGIVLLCHFHSLSSFVFSCGLIQDTDSPPTKKPRQVMQESDGPPVRTISEAECSRSVSPPCIPPAAIRVDAIVARMKALSETGEPSGSQEPPVDIEIEVGEIAVEDPQISQFILDPTFSYSDFYKRKKDKSEVHFKTMRVQDYSWDDQGYSIIDSLYSEVGKHLDDKFRSAYNLTYFTMAGRKGVDTTKFRRAIWNYILCIYGIRYDDYNYREINELLDKPFKMFIKTACCFPEKITKQDYDSVFYDLTKSEKVHVNLMIMEARNQSELLYALRGMMDYMT